MKGKEIHLTTPHLVHKIWGNEKLAARKGAEGKIGESWEVSRLPNEESLINGAPISSCFSEAELPYLIKFLDTTDVLSVQVHPTTEYAKKFENSSGKSECWIVMRTLPGAGIYLGFDQNVTKEDFARGLKRGEDMTSKLRFYPVSEGDFFYVPAGAVHAIGAGVLLCEVQEMSGITYRVFDWNRSDESGKPRALHVEKALDVLNFDQKFNSEENFRIRRDLFEENQLRIELVTHPSFQVELIRMRAGESREFMIVPSSRAPSIVLLHGEVTLQTENESLHLNEMRSVVMERSIEKLKILSVAESFLIWVK